MPRKINHPQTEEEIEEFHGPYLKHWDRLITARSAAGLTQKQVAEAIGVSLVTYNRWENKPILPETAYPFLNLSKLLGVSIDWLFGNDAMSDDLDDEEIETLKKATEILIRHSGGKKEE